MEGGRHRPPGELPLPRSVTDLRALALLVTGLAVANLARTGVVPGRWHLPFNLAILVFVVAVALVAELSPADLGLSRSALPAGLRLGGMAFGLVTLAVAAAGAAGALSDDRVDVTLGQMLLRVLVVIPLATVIMEELAFRGALHALLLRTGGPRWAWVGGAVLFGLWHVFPAWRSATGLTAAATMVATTVAGAVFLWLRVRSGSLLAPALAHLATNSVTFALAWLWR